MAGVREGRAMKKLIIRAMTLELCLDLIPYLHTHNEDCSYNDKRCIHICIKQMQIWQRY